MGEVGADLRDPLRPGQGAGQRTGHQNHAIRLRRYILSRYIRHSEAPIKDLAGAEQTVLHLVVECTDDVLREKERKQREVQLSRAADDSMDAIVSLDTDGRIRYWNKGAERMFGYSAAEV